MFLPELDIILDTLFLSQADRKVNTNRRTSRRHGYFQILGSVSQVLRQAVQPKAGVNDLLLPELV